MDGPIVMVHAKPIRILSVEDHPVFREGFGYDHRLSGGYASCCAGSICGRGHR